MALSTQIYDGETVSDLYKKHAYEFTSPKSSMYRSWPNNGIVAYYLTN